MQLNLASGLHIVLTCSFVLLLAYLLSTILSYLASSLIHGSSAKAPRQRETQRLNSSSGSSSRRRSPTIEEELEQEIQAETLMDRLQEEDEDEEEEEEEEKDVYIDAETRTVAAHGGDRRFEIADSIFEDGMNGEDAAGMNLGRDDEYVTPRSEGGSGEQLYIGRGVGKEKLYTLGDGGEQQIEEQIEEEAEEKGSRLNGDGDAEEKLGQAAAASTMSSNGKLGDPQGSSSLKQQQQRLPPTWSDLEKMVNLSSNKLLPSPPAPAADQSPLDEYN